jgi:hypothetical protein
MGAAGGRGMVVPGPEKTGTSVSISTAPQRQAPDMLAAASIFGLFRFSAVSALIFPAMALCPIYLDADQQTLDSPRQSRLWVRLRPQY